MVYPSTCASEPVGRAHPTADHLPAAYQNIAAVKATL